ncbi:MAG: PQQ-like beta-propeller repeat protein [Clostridia bacterium]|nr:PQQ-like beta-propeller repeat protein [Clostridia bacterium]
MISKNVKYKKQIVKKKTLSIILYGIIFLISTLAYYFVSNSNASNVLKIEAFVIDEELKIESTSYEMSATENNKKYTVTLPTTQNGFVVSKYIMLTEEEYNQLKQLEENGKEDEQESNKTDTKKDTNNKENQIKKLESNLISQKIENTTTEKETSNEVSTTKAEENKIEAKAEETLNNEESKAKEEDDKEEKEKVVEVENTTVDEKINKEDIDNKNENETEKEPKEELKEVSNDVKNNEEQKDEEENEEDKKECKTENENDEANIEEKDEKTDKEEIKDEEDEKDKLKEEEKDSKQEKNEEKNVEEEKKEETKPKSLEEILAEIKGKEFLPEDEIELKEDEIAGKKLYFIAVYDKKEVKGKELYNKIVSEKVGNNAITISGYMPEDAEAKVTIVDAKSVEDKISNSTKTNVKLQAAFDIKIISNGKEYEPNEFDEDVNVIINGLDNQKINIWHVKSDDNVEKIEVNISKKDVEFKASSFSIYGVEVVEDEENVQNETDLSKNEASDTSKEDKTEEQEEKNETPTETTGGTKASPPLRAPAPNIPDTTLTINDYTSDYYYYLGKNYTDNPGTIGTTYSDSSLARVTINYYGFAQGESDPEKKGRISLTETQDIVQNIRCVPKGNNVVIELMENPFMDKPTGYGFGGWTASTGTVSQDSQTLSYKLTLSVSGETTVDLYAIWNAAKVVYVNQTGGNDNLNDGLSEDSPFGSWGKACETLYNTSTDRNDREKNIIVVTGNMDSSINYTKAVTGAVRNIGNTTYNRSTTITSGNTYIISTGQGANSYALAANGTSLTREQLLSDTEPSANTQWTITASGNGYTIRDQNGRYLSYSGGLVLNNTASVWTFSSNRFRNGNRYLRYTNNAWTATNSTSGATIYLLTYNFVNLGQQVINTPASGFSTNNYYNTGTGNRSMALTVTSLYNHTDYRNNAVITLPEDNNGDWYVYDDFQMDYINIYTGGYSSNTNGDTFTTRYAFLYGNSHNVRLGRGMICASNATFANVIGASQSTGSQNNTNNAYKMIVESGRYSEIIGFNYTGTNNYYGTVYLTLGSDIDRVSVNNNNLLVYYASTINIGGGINGKSNVNDMAFLINVKSGSIGTPYFDANTTNQNSAYSGIYVGGWGTSDSNNRDISDRYCIVEGGKLSNIVGGLKTISGTPVKTRVFVKGGELYNIVGGGRSYTNLWR